MKPSLYALLIAQFLTAFGDNAILFTAFAILSQQAAHGEWYKPAMQASFFLSFVLLAPWVGRLADRLAKGRVLGVGNIIKALGALLLLAGFNPLLAYGIVGIGAAIYGPAKYGILPELVSHDRLVKANGWVEGSTIIAIVLGAVIGAKLADRSIATALWMITLLYLVSLFTTLFIKGVTATQHDHAPALRAFVTQMGSFFETSRARFSMLGAAIFWAAAVVLRVMLVAWAPAVLLTSTTSEIANLTVFIALGIAVGSVIVPWLIPIERLRRARLAAYLMGILIMLLGLSDSAVNAKVVLFAIGFSGGLFVVPINAALQEVGHRTIGSGSAVAIQNFFENLAMLVGTGLYTLALGNSADPVIAIYTLGLLVIFATTFIAWHLPRETSPAAGFRSRPSA